MALVPLSEVSNLLGVPPSDAKVLVQRADFPSPRLTLPEYQYWDSQEILNWVFHLHLSPDELRSLVSMTLPDTGETRREHFYVRQCDLEGTDDAALLVDGFDLLHEDNKYGEIYE